MRNICFHIKYSLGDLTQSATELILKFFLFSVPIKKLEGSAEQRDSALITKFNENYDIETNTFATTETAFCSV